MTEAADAAVDKASSKPPVPEGESKNEKEAAAGTELKTDSRVITQALEAFAAEEGVYPTGDQMAKDPAALLNILSVPNARRLCYCSLAAPPR